MMKKRTITQRDYIKANRKASREAEIENHSRPVSFSRVHKSKRVYDRKRSKAGKNNDFDLPFLCTIPTCFLENAIKAFVIS